MGFKIKIRGVSLMPEGRHEFGVEAIDEWVSSSSGNPCLKATLRPLNGDHEQEKLVRFLPLVGDGRRFLIEFLAACGVELDDDEELVLDSDELLTATVSARVVHETYQGRERAALYDFQAVEGDIAAE